MHRAGHCDACGAFVDVVADGISSDGVQLVLPILSASCPLCASELRLVLVHVSAHPHSCGHQCKRARSSECRCVCAGRYHSVDIHSKPTGRSKPQAKHHASDATEGPFDRSWLKV